MIHDSLDGVLVGQDPFMIEKLWQDMYWRVRGIARKGVAFQAIAAIDIALWDLKGKVLNQPIYLLLGPAHETVPIYGSGGWTNYSEGELVAEQMGYVEGGNSSCEDESRQGFRSIRARRYRTSCRRPKGSW